MQKQRQGQVKLRWPIRPVEIGSRVSVRVPGPGLVVSCHELKGSDSIDEFGVHETF